MSPPKARPSHYWCTFRKASYKFIFTSHTTARTHILTPQHCCFSVCCVDLHSATDALVNPAAHCTAQIHILFYTNLALLLSELDRQTDRHWPPLQSLFIHDQRVHTVCVPMHFFLTFANECVTSLNVCVTLSDSCEYR